MWRKSARLILAMLVIGMFFWLFDSTHEYYHYSRHFYSREYSESLTLYKSLLGKVPGHILLHRFIFVGTAMLVGAVFLFFIVRYRRGRESLHKSENRFQCLFEQSPLGVAVCDEEGYFQEINPAALKMFGIPSVEDYRKVNLFRSPDIPVEVLDSLRQGKTIFFDLEMDFNHGTQRQYPHYTQKGRRYYEFLASPLEVGDREGRRYLLQIQEVTERLNAQRKIEEANERLRQIIDHVPDRIFIKDNEGRFLMGNQAAAHPFNLSPEELVGKKLLDIHPDPESAQKMLAEDRKVLETGKMLEIEEEFRDSEGKKHYLRTIKMPHKLPGRSDTVMLGVSTDITEQKENNANLLYQQRLHTKLIENLPLGVFAKDCEREGCYFIWNQSIEQITGWKATNILGKTSHAILPSDLADFCDREDREIMETGEVRIVEDRHLDTPCGPRDLRVTKVPIPDVNGNVTVIFGLINDITDRKQAEKILRDSEFRYRSLYETMREEVALHGVVYDEAGHPIDYRILDVNPAFTAITGITSEQAVGALASELYGTGEPPYLDIYARVAETGESEHFETYFAPMDKHFSISCISPQKGFFATVATDVTDHKKLETELRQSEKMRAIGQLAGGVAHDFNNQLAGILGYASMLESRVEDPKLVEYARGIITASKRSAELTQKLLDFSRKGRMLAMPVSAHGMIQEVSSMLGHSIDKRIRILQNLTAEWDVVLGDPTQLENALLNLCLNARDAMPDGGELMLRTQNVTLREEDLLVSHNQIPPGKYLAIVVSDTGCGIKEEILPHIFEPFFTTKESGQGTGMGLAAVFGAVKSHHGGIEVYSEPNQGSAFTIYLPVSEESADFSYAGTPSGVVQKGTRILLVEDEEFIRKVMMEMLTDLGYAVETCSNGEEAVQYYKTHWEEVDLVFLDMIMPKMNGREAFLEMKKINSDIHAILLSGYGQNQEVQEMIDQGMHGFIQKPVGQAELAAKIGEILNP